MDPATIEMKRPNSNPPSGNAGNSNTSTKPWFSSYQSGYQPPVHYANDQTSTLQETTKTYYQADETAGNVLNKMTMQRSQLESAHGSVWEMRQATAAAKRQIEELLNKNRLKKQRLYLMIAAVGLADLLLFFRLLQCRGSFFC